MTPDLPETLLGCRDASAVILVRDGPAGPEVFLVKRHSKSKFMAGAFVFPGGKVDASDCVLQGEPDVSSQWVARLDVTSGTVLSHERARGFGVAACRELLEEGQVDLSCGVSTRGAALEHLTYYAHWVTPSLEPRRFDTRFFIALLPEGQEAEHDAHECVDSRWVSFRDALDEQRAGELVLPPPTLKIIDELSGFQKCRDILEYASSIVVEAWMPKAVQGGREGDFSILLPWDPEYDQAPGDSLTLHEQAAAEARSPRVARLELVNGCWRMLASV